MFGSSLHPVICACLRIAVCFCFVCFRPVSWVLPVSPDFPFSIVPSVFSNVYLVRQQRFWINFTRYAIALGSSNPKGLNRITKIDKCHHCLTLYRTINVNNIMYLIYHVSAETLIFGWMIPTKSIVHQQRY